MSGAKEGQRMGMGDLLNPGTNVEADEFDKDAEDLGMRGVCMETLFVLVLGNNISDILEWILLFTEDLQIIYGAFPRETDIAAHTFPLPLWLGFVFNPLAPRMYATYSEYIQYFSITLFAILFWGANGAYVAYTVYRGTYVVSPLHTFRLLSAFFPSVLFIPMVEMMLSAILECTYKSDAHLTLVSEETVPCLSGFHVGTYVLACACLLFFIPVSIFLNTNFVSTDPTHKRPSSRVHGRCDAIYAVLKVFLLVITRVLAENFPAAELSVIFVSTAMLCLIDRFRPHYNNLVNNCRCASFASVLVFAIMVLALRVSPLMDSNAALAIVLVGTCVTWLMAFYLSAYRYRLRCSRVQQRLKEVETLTGFVQKNYLVFNDWPSVEIACRFITDGMDDRRRAFDESKIPLVHAIFKRGVDEFPHAPFVHLSYHLYSSFLRSNNSNWYYPLAATKKLAPAFDVAFFVYLTEGLESRQAQMTLLGSTVELKVTDFAEYKKLEKAAVSNHEKARQQIRIFWHVICREKSQPDTVSGIVSDVCLAVDHADKSYRRLLRLYPASISINRSYGAFLMEIKHEPETAESYIQRAEDLDKKAMARMTRMEAFGDDTSQQSFSNHDVAEAENAEMSPTDRASNESFEERPLKRSNSRNSESSRVSSNTNSAGRRLTVMQNMSSAADGRIRRFTIGSTMLVLAGIGVIIGANVQIEGILAEEDTRQGYGRILRRRTYFCSEIFLLLRRMIMAAKDADEHDFQFQRSRLVHMTEEYRDLALAAYKDLPRDMTALRDSFITPTVRHIQRVYPANITIVDETTLFDFSENFGNKAAVLLDLDFSRFAQANITFNEDVRYVFDNYQPIKAAFTANMAEFQAKASVHSESHIEMWSFSLVVCVLFICGAAFIIEFWFRDMREHHLRRLDLFKKIPRNIRTAIRDNLDNAAEESMEPGHLSYRTEHVNFLKKFRRLGLVLVSCMSILACAFAANGTTALSDISMLAGVVTPLGELRSSAIAIDLSVEELMVQDIPATWPNSSMIYNMFEDAFDYYSSMLNEVIYPSKNSAGLSQFPAPMFALWFHPSCLAADAVVCANPGYNYDIGFTPAVVQNGLGTLLLEYRNAASAVAVTAKNGVLDKDDPNGLFILTANRDFVTNGLVRLTELGVDTLHQNIVKNRSITYSILCIQLAVALLGYIFVFRGMSRWYRERDNATNLLLMILPPSALKSDPELEIFLKTGIIADKTNASEVSLPGGQPIPERRGSIFKNPSALGSHISLAIDNIRRGSRSAPKAEKGDLVIIDANSDKQFEARLKKLQFEEQEASDIEPPHPPMMSRSMSNSRRTSDSRRTSEIQHRSSLRSYPTLSSSAEMVLEK